MNLAIATVIGLVLAPAAANSAEDAPEPPMLYNGHWTLTASDGKVAEVDNRCAEDRKFVTCEQSLDGKVTTLLVFLRVGISATEKQYLTANVEASGSPVGPWGHLTIMGDHWVYFSDTPDRASGTYHRDINDFHGPNRIHYEVQSSKDNQTWTTIASGDEQKGP